MEKYKDIEKDFNRQFKNFQKIFIEITTLGLITQNIKEIYLLFHYGSDSTGIILHLCPSKQSIDTCKNINILLDRVPVRLCGLYFAHFVTKILNPLADINIAANKKFITLKAVIMKQHCLEECLL